MFDECNKTIFNLDLYFKQNRYIKTVDRNYDCCLFQSCSKAHHLFAYFLEILIRLYLKNVKDITISFLSFSSDFSEIS